jgi:hypothetical protein
MAVGNRHHVVHLPAIFKDFADTCGAIHLGGEDDRMVKFIIFTLQKRGRDRESGESGE